MAIDATIPLGIRAPQFEGPLDLAAKYQAYQNGQMENRLSQRKLQAFDTEDQRKNALQGILKNSTDPTTGQYDLNRTKTALMQGGYFDEAQTLNKQAIEQQQQERMAATAKIDDALKKGGFIAQNLQGAQTPDDYAARVQHIEKTIGPQENLHVPWHPGLVDQFMQSYMPIKDQLEQHKAALAQANSDRSFGLQQQEFGLKQQAADESRTEQTFTPSAIDNAAARYNMDGTLPPMGMGKSGALGRSAILNRAAELAQGTSGGDQRVAQMGFKANSQALGQLQKQQTMVGSFERNANKNLDLALNLGDKVDKTGIPIVNKWIQSGQKNLTGDPDIAAFHAANETFVNEYAKVMSGSMGNTAVSDSARQHAHELLSTAQSPEQYKAVADTLKKDMANRMSGFEDEKASLSQTMKGGKAQSPPQASTSTMTATNPKTGERVQSTDGGQSWHAIK